jgi:DNA-binding NtrC family response regulator
MTVPDCFATDPADLPTSGGNSDLDLDQLASGCRHLGGMIARSNPMLEVFKAINRLASYNTTVMIQGESGTGKELVARSFHTNGATPRGPFVILNCSNLLDTLAESQLFGHIRGAFTDAREDSLGYFRAANGGTLFLDEVGEMPLRLQAKLLRAVETYEIQPVGSSHSYHVDIRLVVATNRDLRAMSECSEFRHDLYYRLNAASITLPPLRARLDDIPGLASHFIELYDRILGKKIKFLTRAALASLTAHHWPGNVREFANAIQHSIMMSESDRIEANHLPASVREPASASACASSNSVNAPLSLPTGQDFSHPGSNSVGAGRSATFVLDEVMKTTLIRSLDETGGNRRRAADLLGISRSTLYRMMSRYGLDRSDTRAIAKHASPGDLSV